MVTLITRPMPGPRFIGETGAERAKARELWMRDQNPIPATKETRQNFRAMLRKAKKLAARGQA